MTLQPLPVGFHEGLRLAASGVWGDADVTRLERCRRQSVIWGLSRSLVSRSIAWPAAGSGKNQQRGGRWVGEAEGKLANNNH